MSLQNSIFQSLAPKLNDSRISQTAANHQTNAINTSTTIPELSVTESLQHAPKPRVHHLQPPRSSRMAKSKLYKSFFKAGVNESVVSTGT